MAAREREHRDKDLSLVCYSCGRTELFYSALDALRSGWDSHEQIVVCSGCCIPAQGIPRGDYFAVSPAAKTPVAAANHIFIPLF